MVILISFFSSTTAAISQIRELYCTFRDDVTPADVTDQFLQMVRIPRLQSGISVLPSGQWICWTPPDTSWLKLNCDGSCVDGLCSGGGVVRDSNGSVLVAFSSGPGSNNMGEAKALLQGAKLCCSYGWDRLIIESDSLLMVQALQGKGQFPSHLTYTIRECKFLIKPQFVIQHIFREANMVADFLAGDAQNHRRTCIYDSCGSLLSTGFHLVKEDAEGKLYFRK